jgi:uncharacterized LabA/DUF88 family protein
MPQKKAIFYIDGFNLYFSLKLNGWKEYYWLDVVKLCSQFTYPGHYLTKVKYFTAAVRKPSDKTQRQNAYLRALGTLPFIEIIYGRYQYNEMLCYDCGRSISVPKEKKTDVNIASQMIMDAVKNKYEVQYLLTGDSDLVPPVELIKNNFPQRQIFLLCPPKVHLNDKSLVNRMSNELVSICDNHRYIKEADISACILPKNVDNRYGKPITCPDEWC